MRIQPLLLSSIFLVGALAAVAPAQDAFPNSPANHWAYEALARLRSEGILVGYPDGLYRGSRPLSRYEMAVALHSGYAKISSQLDQIQAALAGLKPGEIPELRDQLAALQDQLNSYRKLKPDLDDLKRAADTFELELEQLGVDVEQMKRTLGSLESRVSVLEKKKPPIDIHGDTNFWLGSGTSRNHLFGLNKDGRIEGDSTPGGVSDLFPPVAGVGFEHDLTVLHEAAFTLSGTNSKGPQWSATVVETDMFGNFGAKVPTVGFGNQSDVWNLTAAGNPQVTGLFGYASGLEDIYLQDASIEFGGPKGFLQVGRVGYSMNPYLFRRLDNTSYFSNDRWDNGTYYFDGGIAGGSAGPLRLTLFGGLDSAVQSLHGVQINPIRSGPIGGIFSPVQQDGSGMNVPTGTLTFDRNLGGDLTLSLGKVASATAGLVLLEGDQNNLFGQNNNVPLDVQTNANRLAVYGLDGTVRLGPLRLEGGAHKSDIQENAQTQVGSDNGAWNVKLGFDRSALGAYAEYRQVEPNYVAPGDWGRMGILRNPTNIKGLRVGAHARIFRRFKLSASGLFDSGLLNGYAVTTYLGTGTNVRGYDVRLSFDVSHALSVYADLENTHFGNLAAPATYAGSGDPNYRWTTFGVHYRMGDNSFCNVAYEQSDVDNDYQVSGGAAFHGGFLTSQLTYKF